MLSAGKNYVRVLAGEEPEYVPQYSFIAACLRKLYFEKYVTCMPN